MFISKFTRKIFNGHFVTNIFLPNSFTINWRVKVILSRSAGFKMYPPLLQGTKMIPKVQVWPSRPDDYEAVMAIISDNCLKNKWTTKVKT